MGDHAEEFLDGMVDWDGSYDPSYGSGRGYPREIDEETQMRSRGKPEQPTDKNRLNGIVGWLNSNRRIALPRNSNTGPGWLQVVFAYGRDRLGLMDQRSIVRAISADFATFTKWVNINYRV